MSRATALRTFCLGLLWLGFAPAVSAQTDNANSAVDGLSGPRAALEALSSGRRAKGEGRLARAEVHFQKSLSISKRNDEVYNTALEELTYHLPLMRVERYVLSHQWLKAEQLLQNMLEQHRSDEDKSRHLVELIARLRSRSGDPGQAGVYTQRGSGRDAVSRIEQVLDRFLKLNGRYPGGYDELNDILPADRYPLDEYDIVHYVGSGDAYGLTLRSKKEPGNLLSVQKTGLME